jgi:hypothetical protein
VHDVEAASGSPATALVMWTDDVDTACTELAAAQAPVLQPPQDIGNNNRNACCAIQTEIACCAIQTELLWRSRPVSAAREN